MNIKIGNVSFSEFANCEVQLQYDSIASTFAIDLLYDPNNPTHKRLLQPLTYRTIVIEHNGTRLLTGTILKHHAESSGTTPKTLMKIAGYSVTGVLGDSTGIHGGNINVPVMFENGCTFRQILDAIVPIFGLKYRVQQYKGAEDKEIGLALDKQFQSKGLKEDEVVASFLNKIATQLNLVLSHDAYGYLFITRANVDHSFDLPEITYTPALSIIEGYPQICENRQYVKNMDVIHAHDYYIEYLSNTKIHEVERRPASIATFDSVQPKNKFEKMTLDANGQGMHSLIQVVSEYVVNTDPNTTFDPTAQQNNSPIDAVYINQLLLPYYNKPRLLSYIADPAYNPYISGFYFKRYKRVIQTSGTEIENQLSARALVGAEFEGIELGIDLEGLTVNNYVLRPNNIILVRNPDLGLHRLCKWFIKSVTLRETATTQTASLTCCMPECFNDAAEIVNPFEV